MNPPQIAGQLVLFLLMFAVGLELTPADFRRVLASPRAVVGGTLGQILLLPAMTWAVMDGLGVNPVFSAGAILVAVSPGAGLSNVMAALARANVALSVTLTAVTSVLAALTLPTITSVGMRLFLGDEGSVEVPVANLVMQLGLSLLLPIFLGMWLRSLRPELADRYAPILHRVIMLVVALVIVLSIAFTENDPVDFEGSGIAFVAAGVWTLAAMVLGWSIAGLLRLSTEDRVTFLIEFSARNIAVASIVALSGLGRLDLTLFSGIYAAVAYPMVGLLAWWHRREVGKSKPTIPPPASNC
jgi:BASS family bile acid:Na+ symporter